MLNCPSFIAVRTQSLLSCGRTGMMLILALVFSMPSSVFAYKVFDRGECDGIGQRWGTVNTVKVRINVTSFLDYFAANPTDYPEELVDVTLEDLRADVVAVIDEFNSVPGVDLTLELGADIVDKKYSLGLKDYQHRIIIGLYDETRALANGKTAPAWVARTHDCIYTQKNVSFNGTVLFWFGTPQDHGYEYWDEGKATRTRYFFRSILTHEMGHAVGLAHSKNKYSVMNHGDKAWTRSTEDTADFSLLPDDANGLRNLYGNDEPIHLDLSVTNNWFIPAAEMEDDDAAQQVRNCKISERADSYPEVSEDSAAYCGVSDDPAQTVVDRACPGEDIQVRYSLNNHDDRSIVTDEQVWFSLDDEFDYDTDIISPTRRELTVGAKSSALVGRVFEVPDDLAPETYWVFARAIPYTEAGGLLWGSDVDQWNNSIPLRGTIVVERCIEAPWLN
jgi:hypothetical protein